LISCRLGYFVQVRILTDKRRQLVVIEQVLKFVIVPFSKAAHAFVDRFSSGFILNRNVGEFRIVLNLQLSTQTSSWL